MSCSDPDTLSLLCSGSSLNFVNTSRAPVRCSMRRRAASRNLLSRRLGIGISIGSAASARFSMTATSSRADHVWCKRVASARMESSLLSPRRLRTWRIPDWSATFLVPTGKLVSTRIINGIKSSAPPSTKSSRYIRKNCSPRKRKKVLSTAGVIGLHKNSRMTARWSVWYVDRRIFSSSSTESILKPASPSHSSSRLWWSRLSARSAAPRLALVGSTLASSSPRQLSDPQ
mmetsp:Transcript_20322/g.52710  ORF Transcript_20322/g.52710 Transcript_20322/m.52710 type:complete len:230 (-) Transcript_20322:547-1236(-)